MSKSQLLSILSTEELADRVKRRVSDITIIDARRDGEYRDGHIPGAASIAWEEWVGMPPENVPDQFLEPGWWGLLADPIENRFDRQLAKAGVRSDSEIIIYGDGTRTKGRDGRLAWMLLYLGAPQVSLLDGGWSQWCKNGYSIESRNTVEAEGSFQMNLKKERRILIDELATRVGASSGLTLWDSRTEREYDGEIYSYLPRKGHIPGSTLFTYDTIYQSGSSRFVSREQFLRLLENMPPRETKRVAYCELGLRAATIAFLHECYTGEMVSIFDGGYMQWSLETKLPVVQIAR